MTIPNVCSAGPPIQMSGTPAGPVEHAPELGQHREEVLPGAGYTWEDLEALRRGDMIGRMGLVRPCIGHSLC